MFWFTIEKKITTFFLIYTSWSLFPNFFIVVASQDKKTHNTVGTQGFYWQDGGLSPTSRDVNVTVTTLPSSKLVSYPFLVDKTPYPIDSPTLLPENAEVANQKKKAKKGTQF